MARLMRFDYLCDNSSVHKRASVEGDTLLVWSPKYGEIREMELCEGCQEKVSIHQAQEMVDLVGRKIVGPKQDPDLICPYGCNRSRPFASAGRKDRHMRITHPEIRVG